MQIAVFADFVCPWCYVGKRRLERALASRPGLAPRIVWQPFRLDPSVPQEGLDRQVYLAQKFGSRDRLAAITAMLTEAAAREGLAFALDRQTRTPNTGKAHRLMRFAAAHGRADALAEALFAAYFCAARDIGQPAVLASLAGEAGLDEAAAARFLASDAEADQVEAGDLLARQNGITGVPFFIFARRYALSGAQEPEAFLPIFDALEAEGLKAAAG